MSWIVSPTPKSWYLKMWLFVDKVFKEVIKVK